MVSTLRSLSISTAAAAPPTASAYERYRAHLLGRENTLGENETQVLDAAVAQLGLNAHELILLDHYLLCRSPADHWDLKTISRSRPFRELGGNGDRYKRIEQQIAGLRARLERALTMALEPAMSTPGGLPAPIANRLSGQPRRPTHLYWPLVREAIAQLCKGASFEDRLLYRRRLALPNPDTSEKLARVLTQKLGKPVNTERVHTREQVLADKIVRTMLRPSALHEMLFTFELRETQRDVLDPAIPNAIKGIRDAGLDALDARILDELVAPLIGRSRWDEVAKAWGISQGKLIARRNVLVEQVRQRVGLRRS